MDRGGKNRRSLLDDSPLASPATSRAPVAFFGLPGSWTHMAARRIFGRAATYRETPTISEVFRAVAGGAYEFGVVPIENSTEGGVNQTVDELITSDLRIRAEVVLAIAQCLAGLTRDAKAIRRVASHPQGLAQCRRWLAEHLPGVEQVAALSTSAAAREASLDPTLAAVASELAAELNGLEVLERDIQDDSHNATRFVVIAATDAAATGHDKTSLAFSTAHSRGALRRSLEVFDRAGINLSRIESRPAPGRRWEYVFLTDLEGHREDSEVKSALSELAETCSTVRVLGSYPRAT